MSTVLPELPEHERPRTLRRSDVWIVALLAAWLIGVCAVLWWLGKYNSTPGAVGTEPASWPASTLIARDPGRPQLVMFLHPKCACARASLAELNELVSRARGRFAVDIALLVPAGVHADWRQGPVWDGARRIPGANVTADFGGIEAQRFGAETSGHVEVFDTSGALLYGGGITVARGHMGDNLGQRRVWEAITTGRPARPDGRVFGCSLVTPPERGSGSR